MAVEQCNPGNPPLSAGAVPARAGAGPNPLLDYEPNGSLDLSETLTNVRELAGFVEYFQADTNRAFAAEAYRPGLFHIQQTLNGALDVVSSSVDPEAAPDVGPVLSALERATLQDTYTELDQALRKVSGLASTVMGSKNDPDPATASASAIYDEARTALELLHNSAELFGYSEGDAK